MPVATRAGKTALCGLAALALGAGLTGHPSLGIATVIAIALLLWSYGSVALLLFELKRRRLEFTWRLPLETIDLRAGRSLFIELRFRNLSPYSWRGVRVELCGSEALESGAVEVDLLRRSRFRAQLSVQAHRAGRWMAHGAVLAFEDAGGLFRIAPYCARPLPLRIRPAGGAGAGAHPAEARAEGATRARRQRGFGTDLREIREHRHGDPFRRIAWKASARRGQLMVREFEAEVRVPVMLAVDVGPSMRTGGPEAAPIDLAVRAALAFAEASLSEGDPAGVVTFSSRLGAVVSPRNAADQLRRLEDALLDAIAYVHTDEVVDGRIGVLRVVAAYLSREVGLRVHPELRGPGDDALVMSTVDHLLHRMVRQGRLDEIALLEDERLSQFVAALGIDVPPATRIEWRPRERGFAAAIQAVARDPARVKLLLAISDLEGIEDASVLGRELARLRARGARAAIVVPPPSRGGTGTGRPRDEADARLRRIARGQRRRGVIEMISRAGVPVFTAAPEEDLRGLLARAASYRESIRRAG